jgi:hypothetical protein
MSTLVQWQRSVLTENREPRKQKPERKIESCSARKDLKEN